VVMSEIVGAEGHFYLHPAVSIDMRTGKEVAYRSAGAS
jgi:hypothetical protein